MKVIREPEKEIPVRYETDICVIGGGCAGTMAAVRAARLGASVLLLERGNMFGGAATEGLVNVWHSLYDTDGREQIIHGLTEEAEQMLLKDGAALIENNADAGIRFNPVRMAVVLDRLVRQEKIHVLFHTLYAGVSMDEDRIDAVFIENKDGRSAVKARFFIDASGDGDLCRDVGIEAYRNSPLQPPSSCVFLQNVPGKTFDPGDLIRKHGKEFGLDDDWGWSGVIPGLPSLSFRADNHIFGVDPSKAEELTLAELLGREKSAAFSDLLKKYVDPGFELANTASSIGIRDSVHYRTRYQVKERDLLLGRKFEHTVMRGTYRLDVHHQEDNGITFRYLDGRTDTFYGKDERAVHGNWIREYRERGELPENFEPSKYYSAPWEMLVPEVCRNLIPAGRMLNAEASAFGALRVMVNLNQLGEAAGAGAVISLEKGISVQEVSGADVVGRLERF